MKISIVNGFFLPVPPVRGGATEKSWFRLAREFAARGHEVTVISRRWPGCADRETVDGIRHIRLPGSDHRRRRWANLLLDFAWSWRVFFALPPADIVVVNTVTLPIWLGTLRSGAGKVVIMTGRMPKGQYRHYRQVAQVLAASTFVRDQVVAENPRLQSVATVRGYPIDWRVLAEAELPAPPILAERQKGVLTVGYVGRIHEEKGLRLLAAALKLLARVPDLPPWRLLLCGPADTARGGSGAVFRGQLMQEVSAAMPAGRFNLLDPQFDERTLAAIYRQIDLFCYPSLAETGETFGVAVSEAMSACAVPVVSGLACFADFVRPGENGLVFDHTAPDAAARLATALSTLMRDAPLRPRLAGAAREDVQRYDYSRYAEALLAGFAQLTAPAKPASSPP